METFGPTYIAYARVWTQHALNCYGIGRLHAAVSSEQLRCHAKHAAPQHKMLADAWLGASYATACNPFAKADFATGTSAALALRSPHQPWGQRLAWNAAAHQARLAYVLADDAAAHTDYTEHGVSGEVINHLYNSAAIPAYAASHGLAYVVGAIVGTILTAGAWIGRRVCNTTWRAPGIFTLASTCGVITGAVVGTLSGTLAAALPYSVLLTTRLALWTFKAAAALLGFVLGGLVGLRHVIPPLCRRLAGTLAQQPDAPKWDATQVPHRCGAV